MFIFSVLMLMEASFAHAGEFDYQGQIAGYEASMPQLKRDDVTKNDAGFEGYFKTKYAFNKNFNFQLQPWFKYDATNKTPAEKFQADPQELSFEWKKSARKIKIGYSTAVWEGTDIINPMDIASVKNYRDPFSVQNRGTAGIFYSDQIGKFSWDALFIPWNSKVLMPGQESPWLPRDTSMFQDTGYQVQLPDAVIYSVQSDIVLNRALANNGGLRLQYHGDSVDLSVGGFEGQASNPMMVPHVNFQGIIIGGQTVLIPQNPIEIFPVYYRQRTVATALSWTLGSWIVRGAAQHTQPLGEDFFSLPNYPLPIALPSWSDYGVLGIEKNIEWGDQNITFIVQGIASHAPKSESVASFQSLLEKSAMVALRFPVKENWTWTTAYFREFKANSSFLHSEVGWNLAEHWKAELSADILLGTKNSVIGTYDQNDRGTFRLSFSF